MKQVHLPPARRYEAGIGDAVANRTVNRKQTIEFERPIRIKKTFPRRDERALDAVVREWCKSEGKILADYLVAEGDEREVLIEALIVGEHRFEIWEDVAFRVALGNSKLEPRLGEQGYEALCAEHHLRQASILMSGRHLQHGDETQKQRPMEVFTNCATSSASFVTFYLLLNGSGVGRAYDDDLMVVDWRKMPIVIPVIRADHPDVLSGEIKAPTANQARHMFSDCQQLHFAVPDSREGWAEAVQLVESMAFDGDARNVALLLDFSEVRERGAPIRGMQNRPSSGPGPLMQALERMARLRDANMQPWRATMFVDHYLAECVLVGGARRAARMSTKSWRDPGIFEFCRIKQGGHLWSSNNSVTVDDTFWAAVKRLRNDPSLLEGPLPAEDEQAWLVFNEINHAAYYDGTGEPGIINQHRLVRNDTGMEIYETGQVLDTSRLNLTESTLRMYARLAERLRRKGYVMITNPCGEIPLLSLAGYCVIGDVVPFHAQDDDDAEGAFRVATRMLMRTNLMRALYDREVKRTNRIGVSMTGIHEYAWKRFGYGFRDLIDEQRSLDFWLTLSRFKRAVVDESIKYAAVLGVAVPHTNTTLKPAGTTSKLFGLTEGGHLPARREYLRYVQFRNDDPLVDYYEALGYPIRRLRTYEGTTVVGFPTRPLICTLGMGEKLVTAQEATPAEQYQWLKLLEKYWIVGVDEAGDALPDTGNQISYTLKMDPKRVSYEEFCTTLLEGQSEIKCCSVLLVDESSSAYEYLPETPITEEEYHAICAELERRSSGEAVQEEVDRAHVDCSSGACPVDFRDRT